MAWLAMSELTRSSPPVCRGISGDRCMMRTLGCLPWHGYAGRRSRGVSCEIRISRTRHGSARMDASVWHSSPLNMSMGVSCSGNLQNRQAFNVPIALKEYQSVFRVYLLDRCRDSESWWTPASHGAARSAHLFYSGYA